MHSKAWQWAQSFEIACFFCMYNHGTYSAFESKQRWVCDIQYKTVIQGTYIKDMIAKKKMEKNKISFSRFVYLLLSVGCRKFTKKRWRQRENFTHDEICGLINRFKESISNNINIKKKKGKLSSWGKNNPDW